MINYHFSNQIEEEDTKKNKNKNKKMKYSIKLNSIMIIFIFIIFIILMTTNAQETLSNVSGSCSSNLSCVHGICDVNQNISFCLCERGWTFPPDKSKFCTYQQKSKLASFLLSFFLGGFGADWYYLSSGYGGYIAAGVFKMLTLGGFGIWWLVDWIRILTNSFVDGQGIALLEWNP